MACKINYSPSGEIISVKNPQGKRSALFDKIHSNLFMADGNTSLKLYMNALSPSINKLFEGKEPDLFYKSGGKEYDNLEELLIDSISGDVQMGFKIPSSEVFLPIGIFSTDSSMRNKFLSSAVQQGYLSAQRSIQSDGSIRFIGKGLFEDTKIVTALMAENELRNTIGEGRVEQHGDGTLTIEFNNELTEMEVPEGKKPIRIEDIPQHVKGNKNIKNKADLLYEYKVKVDPVRQLTRQESVQKKPDTDVKGITNSLMGFLKSVGFTTTTLDSYRETYRNKHGQDPDIEALADIANKVVALKDKADVSEDLAEEVAHIAIEMYSDQNSIAGALALVHQTKEYAEFAEFYREKYSQFFEGVGLEDQVRKEILGKTLKAQIINKFSTENASPQQTTLIERLRELWQSVVNLVTGKVTPSHTRTLKKLNDRIADSIITQTKDDFQNNLEGSEAFFYNAMDTKHKSIAGQLSVAKRVIEDLHKNVLKQQAPSLSELEGLNDSINENTIMSSLNVVVGIAADQTETIEAAIKHATSTGEVISQKDINTAHSLNDVLITMVNNLRNSVGKLTLEDKNKKLFDQLSSVTDELNTKIAKIKPELVKDNEAYIEKMVSDVVDEFDMTDAEQKEFRGHVEGNINDIGWLAKMFGIASQSKNPLIQLLSRKVNMINQKVRKALKNRLNTEIQEIDEKGLLEHQKDIINKNSFYYLSPLNWDKYEKDLTDKENQIIADLLEISVEEAEKLREGTTPANVLKSDELINSYRDQIKEWRNTEGTERRNTDAHYDQREKRFKDANIDKNTQDYINKKNSSMFTIKKKYQNEDGTIDQSKFTEADKVVQRNAYRNHQSQKSAFNNAGDLKEGLNRVNSSDLTISQKEFMPFAIDPDYTGDVTVMEDGVVLEDLTVESRRALDLFNLDMLYRNELKSESKTNTPLKQFSEKLEQLEKSGEISYEWALANASIGLTSEFYEGIGTTKGFTEVAEEYISILDTETAADKRRLLTEHQRLQRLRKDILKQHKKSNNSIETDAYHMTAHNKARIIELDTELAKVKKAINVPFDMQEESGFTGSEGALTQDFHDMLIESGLSEYEFALQHMTRDNSVKVQSFAIDIEDILSGVKTYLKPSFDNFLQESLAEGVVPEGASTEEAVEALKNEYAKRFVGSYFRRFQPIGYTEGINALKSGKVKLSEFIANKEQFLEEFPGLEYVEISPDYTWSEDINNGEFLNKNFKEGIPLTPKLSKYLNDEFFTRFGIKKEDYINLGKDDLSALTPTKNVDQYEFLQRMVNMREESLELQGDAQVINKYLRPQIRKEKAIEKIVSGSIDVATAKDSFTDFFQSKIDEKEYGEQIEGAAQSELSVGIIPKYFQQRVKNSEILTENVFTAAITDYEAALRYKERSNSEREFKALIDKIGNQNLINSGLSTLKNKIYKKGATSNYYSKAQEMVDHHLYGVRETRAIKVPMFGTEVDLTQTFKGITKAIQKSNLALNPLVDVTSLTTAIYNNVIDRVSGDFYTSSAARKAGKILPRMIVDYVSESGNIKKTSDLNHLLEFYGIVDIKDRTEQSASSRVIRGLSKSQFAMSKLANLPATPRILLSILHDHKFHGGKFRSYNNFKKVKQAKDNKISEASIKAEWNAITETLFDNIKIDKNLGVQIGSKFMEKFPENSVEEFDELSDRISAKVTHVVQNVDSQVSAADQTAAQRDALTNAFLMHRSWFILNLTRRFKGRHFNITTGQIESGHYIKALTSVHKLATGLIKGDKRVREEMEEHERRNLKRFGFDLLGMAILVGLTNALLAADDDDDSYLEDFAQLIALRTTSETQSAFFHGLLLATPADIYDQPLIQVKKTLDAFKAVKLLAIGEFNESYQTVKKITIFNRFNQLGDVQKQVDSYLFFNGLTLTGVAEFQ